MVVYTGRSHGYQRNTFMCTNIGLSCTTNGGNFSGKKYGTLMSQNSIFLVQMESLIVGDEWERERHYSHGM